MSVDAALGLIEAVLDSKTEHAPKAAAELIGMRLHNHPNDGKQLGPVVWRTLASTIGDKDSMAGYNWKTMAMTQLDENPGQIVALVLDYLSETDSFLLSSDEIVEVLHEALLRYPAEVWPLIGDFILQTDAYILNLKLDNEVDLVDDVPAAVIIEWMSKNGREAARAIANMVKLRKPLSAIGRYLLENWSSDEEVASTLVTGMYSGVHTGPIYLLYEEILGWLDEWSKDENASVRNWAHQYIPSLREQRDTWEARDEERLID